MEEDSKLEDLSKLLCELQETGVICDLEVQTVAQLFPMAKMKTTYSFRVTNGLTISKYHKILSWMTENYPMFSVKRVYHKHKIVISYSYEE